MRYTTHYSHPKHGSDELGVTFKTVAKAVKFIREVHAEPGAYGMADWLAESNLWVCDSESRRGEIVGEL